MNFGRPLEVVTPTLDGDVLRLLAQADKSFTGREVHRLVEGSSQEGVRRVLLRLVEQGVVESERAGGAVLYRLNRRHLAAPEILALATIRLRFIDQLRGLFASWTLQPSAAAIFGSVARGDADADSDIDILIVRPDPIDPDDPTWRSQITAIEADVEAWTGNSARLIEYGARELAESRRHEAVIREAVREGILVSGSFKEA
jgi:predicted nucleotidyltransferase